MQSQLLKGKRILFANFPADGHFNPLTGLAVALKQSGADVRWYTSKTYARKISSLDIPHYRFIRAMEVENNQFDKAFPERAKIRSQIAKLNFDMINIFINRGPEYFEDIKQIYTEFPFDLMISDNAFTGALFVRELMHIPVIAVGVMPLSVTSKDLPPGGLGMTPSYGLFGKIKQAALRAFANKVIFGKPNKALWQMCRKYHISHNHENVFDMLAKKSDLFLQSGSPGFEYRRSDLGDNIRYIGALLPHSSATQHAQWFDQRLNKYSTVVLVTQGTVEKDVNKLLVPAIEAFQQTDVLLIVTTGGGSTKELQEKFACENVIIEDFIPFNDIMPYADVYITNGGYGGVMLGIEHELPLVVAGVHEGKNEICARIGYFGLGVNLKTETPEPLQLANAVSHVIKDPSFKQNVSNLAKELSGYNPSELIVQHALELVGATRRSARAIQLVSN